MLPSAMSGMQPLCSNSLLETIQPSNLVLDLDGRRNWSRSIAAQLTAASSQYYSRSNLFSGDMKIGSSHRWWDGWVYFDSLASSNMLISRWNSHAPLEAWEYYIALDGSNQLQLTVRQTNGSNAQVSATTFGALSTSTWYYFLAWLDFASSTIKISINNGTADSAAFVGTSVTNENVDFYLGANINNVTVTNFLDGRLQSIATGSLSESISDVIGTIGTRRYNSGNGLSYPEITGDEKTDWGITAYWELSDADSGPQDSQGSNVLSNNNGVTATTGHVKVYLTTDGEDIQTWSDNSGNGNDATQATVASRPVLDTDFPMGVEFASDFLTLGDAGDLDFGTGDFTLFIVGNMSASGVAIFAKDNWSGDGNGFLIFTSAGDDIYYWNGGSSISIGSNSGNNWVACIRRSGTGADETDRWFNGTQGATMTESRTLTNALNCNIANDHAEARTGTGKILRILAWSSALTDVEVSLVNSMLIRENNIS